MNSLLPAVLRYRGLVLLLAMVLAASGWLAWLKLPVDAFPDISPTQAKIILKDRKSTRLNSSHIPLSRMPSSA